MVVLRLSRTGAKKRPFYHVVAKTKRSRRDGGCIERLGYFNPIAKGAEVRLKLEMERIEYWLGVGAQTSDRVANLLKEFSKHGSRTGIEYNDTKQPRKKAAAQEAKPEEAEASADAAKETKE